MVLRYCCCIFPLAVLVYGIHLEPNPEVRIENGLLRGRQNFTEGKSSPYFSFRGIPFAEPPIGDLRFRPPVPRQNWEGVLDATRDGDDCIQGSSPVQGSEDCLFINVYTPKLPWMLRSPLPTMVFISPGGFEGGSSKYEEFGPDYLLEKDVIVITFNYRLGLLGFLSTGDLEVPGNNGMKDQVLALKWVQRNIKQFGGDPGRVTLFGQSAGSAAVSYHLQSPQSQGLFQGAIMESGVSLCLWALSKSISDVAITIGKKLNVTTNNSKTLVDGFRKIDTTTLQETSREVVGQYMFHNNPLDGLVFGPVSEPHHEGAFFSSKSHEQMKNGQFSNVPCIIGFNSLEGSFTFNLLIRMYLARYDLFPDRLTPRSMNIENVDTKREIGLQIKRNYLGKLPVAFSEYLFSKFLSDNLFVRPITEFARLLSTRTPTFLYRFSYEGGLWIPGNRTTPGVTHSEELGYIFKSKHTPSQSDRITRDRMIKMWTDFAKTGNPTPKRDQVLQNVVWERSDHDLTYLDIGNDLIVSRNPEKEKMSFWQDLYNKYGFPPYDTY